MPFHHVYRISLKIFYRIEAIIACESVSDPPRLYTEQDGQQKQMAQERWPSGTFSGDLSKTINLWVIVWDVLLTLSQTPSFASKKPSMYTDTTSVYMMTKKTEWAG
jgi:hypothetical protein